MEEGSLRCDANVSVRRKGEKAFGTKTEVKNMNSFRYVERALEYEIDRQIRLIREGGTVRQETLLWDANLGVALPMRSKEEAHDYRYFPDPDLVPVLIDERWIERVRAGLPELPAPRRDRLVDDLGLPRYDADVLTAEKDLADYFEETLDSLVKLTGRQKQELAKPVSNWVMTEVLRVVGATKISIASFPISAGRLAAMIRLILDGTISGTIAKELFEQMLTDAGDPEAIVTSKGLVQVSDTQVLQETISAVLAASPEQVAKYLGGNEKVFGYLVGEAMKALRGKGNPRIINDLLRSMLNAMKKTS
jgi:aspartyl-tRNA(Asn)/glutamyl-tRNA(Gln) amidotransferase subunit B